MTSVLLGSISVLADTSELQRRAFNDAFSSHGLSWNWDREEYQRLLASNGGRDRIAAYASDRGEDVDADAVHATKSELFQKYVSSEGVPLREGVKEVIKGAREQGHSVALVTTTSPENVQALLQAVSGELDDQPFDLVLDRTDVEETKPSPEVYEEALRVLDEQPEHCVAVEDNPGGVKSANDAGIPCVAFPNSNTVTLQFGEASNVVERLDLDELLALARA